MSCQTTQRQDSGKTIWIINQDSINILYMSTSLTKYEKAQSVIGISNLVQNHRINRSLINLQASALEANRLQKEGNRVRVAIHDLQDKQLKANLNANELQKIGITLQEEERKRIRLKEEEEALLQSELVDKKDAVYHARGDSEEIVESEADGVEKFFKLNSILASLMDAKIESKDFSSFEDKKFADDTHKNIYSHLDEINQNLTDEQSEDVKIITEVLSVDEEEIINVNESGLKKLRVAMAETEEAIAIQKAAIDDEKKSKEKTEEKKLNSQIFERLAHLYIKHKTKKRTLSRRMKINKDDFWNEVGSLEWARKCFGMSEDVLSNKEKGTKEDEIFKYNILSLTKECAKVMEDKKTKTIKPDYTIDDLEDGRWNYMLPGPGENVDELNEWGLSIYGKTLQKDYGFGYWYIEKKTKEDKKFQEEIKILHSRLEKSNSLLEEATLLEEKSELEIKECKATIEDEKETVRALEQKYPFIHTIVANR